MLEDIYKNVRVCADEIKWTNYNKDELFFKCLEAKGTPSYDNFYAGILCRYWGYIGRLWNISHKNIPLEDCYTIVLETINYILEKHVWDDPESSLYKDPKAPEKCWMNVLYRQLNCHITYLNAAKRKGNSFSLSLDKMHEDFADASDGLLELVDVKEDSEFITLIASSTLTAFEKILIDLICYGRDDNDVNVLIKCLKSVDKSNYLYYNNNYDISEVEFDKFLNIIKELNNKNLGKLIRKSLYKIGKEYYGNSY